MLQMSETHEQNLDPASSQNVLCDVEALFDIPLGELHQIAAGMKFSKEATKAAKSVMRRRLQQMAKTRNILLGRRPGGGGCNHDHNTSIGVNPGKAGVIWLYVSRLFIDVDITYRSLVLSP